MIGTRQKHAITLRVRCQRSIINFQSILSAMSKQQLVDALEYYVTTYEVKYVTTVETYITVIGVFFDFIADKLL